MKNKLDNTDTIIVRTLMEDGRKTNLSIAKWMGVSEETVRRRLKRMVETGVVKIMAVPDYSKLGFSVPLLITVECPPGLADSIAGFLETIHSELVVGEGAAAIFYLKSIETVVGRGMIVMRLAAVEENVGWLIRDRLGAAFHSAIWRYEMEVTE